MHIGTRPTDPAPASRSGARRSAQLFGSFFSAVVVVVAAVVAAIGTCELSGVEGRVVKLEAVLVADDIEKRAICFRVASTS